VPSGITNILAGRTAPPRNPHAIVILGGDRYDSFVDKQLITRVEVELASDMSCEASFSVFDPRFEFLDKYNQGDGVPQLVCLFYLGFGNDLGPPVFKGLLARVERGDTDSTFVVYDMGYKMRTKLNAEYHKKLNDVEIVKKLAVRNGLLFEGPDEEANLDKHNSMIQDSKNDWEHSIERAREAGYNLYVRQDTLFMKEPAKIKSPLLRLQNRIDFWTLHNFSLTYKLPENQQSRPKEVEHRARKRGGRRLTGKSDQHSRGHRPVEFRRDPSIHTPSYMKRRAQGHKDLQREPAFTCTIRSIPPLPGVRPDARDTIEIQNVGRLFSGPYLCDKVKHTLTGSEFYTDYTLYRDIAR